MKKWKKAMYSLHADISIYMYVGRNTGSRHIHTGISHYYFSSTGIYLVDNIPVFTGNISVFLFDETNTSIYHNQRSCYCFCSHNCHRHIVRQIRPRHRVNHIVVSTSSPSSQPLPSPFAVAVAVAIIVVAVAVAVAIVAVVPIHVALLLAIVLAKASVTI